MSSAMKSPKNCTLCYIRISLDGHALAHIIVIRIYKVGASETLERVKFREQVLPAVSL